MNDNENASQREQLKNQLLQKAAEGQRRKEIQEKRKKQHS